MRHYWAEDTQDTQDEESDDSRTSGWEGEGGVREGEEFKFSF